MTALSRRGPHEVLRGDLDIVGLSGQVFAPAEAADAPAVAFGHGWLRGSRNYRDLLYHLASWGIVVAAPDTERWPAASDTRLAAELRAALAVVATHPLGTAGRVTVDPEKLGFAGHGFGAAAAVIATDTEPVAGQPALPARGVAAVFPSPTTGALTASAGHAVAPALILAGQPELDTVDGNARPLAQAYGGPVTLRAIPGATSAGLVEHRSIKSLIGINGADKKVHTQVRALLVGFLLHTVGGDPEYAAFADPTQEIGKTDVIDPAAQSEPRLDHISALLGAKPPKRRRPESATPVR